MICSDCKEYARENRLLYDEFYENRDLDNLDNFLWAHKPNCGCPCQHRNPTQWENSFSVPRPGEDDE